MMKTKERNKTNQAPGCMNQSVQFQVLNDAQCEKIVSSAMQILENTGVCIKNARARSILDEAGCQIDGTLVKIPKELVKSCLASVPQKVTIYDRTGNEAFTLDSRSGSSHFVPGMCCVYRFDPETGERRLATRKDAFDTGILIDSLENFDVACGLTLISDCDPRLAGAYEVKELLQATTKPILIMSTNMTEIEASYTMCCAVAGSESAFQEKPFAIAGASATSPLLHDDENLETLLYMFEKKIPAPYLASPIIGATAPVTLAGAVALGTADNMVGMVLSQLINKGCPFLGGDFVDFMDMQTLSFAMTAPEIALAEAACADIYRYLGIPSVCHMGMTDSPVFDQQAAMDITSQLYTAMLSGSSLNFFSGFLETAMSGSLEALYFANDTIGYLNRIIGGIDVNDETLALDVIDEVGPCGSFLGEEHTLEHYAESWTPDALARMNWDTFSKNNKPVYQIRVKERIRSILQAGIKNPLDPEIVDKLNDIMKNAQEKL